MKKLPKLFDHEILLYKISHYNIKKLLIRGFVHIY